MRIKKEAEALSLSCELQDIENERGKSRDVILTKLICKSIDKWMRSLNIWLVGVPRWINPRNIHPVTGTPIQPGTSNVNAWVSPWQGSQ